MFFLTGVVAFFTVGSAFSNASTEVIGPGTKAQFQARFQCDALRALVECPRGVEPNVLHGAYLYFKAVEEDEGKTIAVRESLCAGDDAARLDADELGVCANIASWSTLAITGLALLLCLAFLLCCCVFLVV